jgi:hypothetical protein
MMASTLLHPISTLLRRQSDLKMELYGTFIHPKHCSATTPPRTSISVRGLIMGLLAESVEHEREGQILHNKEKFIISIYVQV